MIPIEKLKRVTVVYVHRNCADGLASAMILKDAFRMLGTSPRIEFLTHGTPEHKKAPVRGYEVLENGEMSLFCDIAPVSPKGTQNNDIIVLDHHVGAQAIVESFGENGVYADAEKEPGVSGAVLAFREVWEPAFHSEYKFTGVGVNPVDATQNFAECVGARDTWQTSDPRFMRGQWISKMLMSKPASYWLEPRASEVHFPVEVRKEMPYLTEGEIANGRALFEAHEEAVRQAVNQMVDFNVEGVHLAVFQEQASGFRLCSDVAEACRWAQGEDIRAKTDVVAGFAYVVDKPGDPPRLLYSLRGLNGFDVCAFAKANGGGGHKAAAGFSVDPKQLVAEGEYSPYDFIASRLGVFLEGGEA